MSANENSFDTSGRAVVVDRLSDRDLVESQPLIYDRPIGLRLLYRDPRSGAEHYLIRYPAGLRAQRHLHSAAHTIVVIEGLLRADGLLVGPGSYVHFPAGVPMHHQAGGDQGCLFVIIFDGPFDVHPVDGDLEGSN